MNEDAVVVIGSGPCGAMATLELLRLGRRVTLLESGAGSPYGAVVKALGHTLIRWYGPGMADPRKGFTSGGDPETVWYRSLQPGGLSNYWTGAVPRFSREDFGHQPGTPIELQWPITYDDLEPHYRSVEEVIGVTASPLTVTNLPAGSVRYPIELPADWAELVGPARELGHGLTPIPMAAGRPWMAARRGTEFSSWHSIIRGLRKHPGLDLRTGAHAERLVWSSAKGQVYAVEYLDQESKERVTVPADAVVVAAGALNSTRLLLASRSDDFPTGLGNVEDVLGRYLHDHPKDWWILETERPLTLPAHPLYMTRHSNGTAAGDLDIPCSWTIGLPSVRLRPRAMAGRGGTRFGVQVFGTMTPDPDHRASLTSSPSAGAGQQSVHLDFGYDDDIRAGMLAARDRLCEVLERGGHHARVPAGDELFLRPGESVHYGGTIRMHARPEFGMVDSRARLHAVPNVHIVDSSVFTTGPEKNPTLTAMAIAAWSVQALANG